MKRKLKKIINDIAENFRSNNDKLGAYTGTAADGSKPTQDADDL